MWKMASPLINDQQPLALVHVVTIPFFFDVENPIWGNGSKPNLIVLRNGICLRRVILEACTIKMQRIPCNDCIITSFGLNTILTVVVYP
jgi:hypothetical protein